MVEDAQIDFPHIHLEIGYEYMVAVTEVDLYTLNRKHARSSRPSFRPFSYIQGILPLVNGEYKDYFDTTAIAESILIDSIGTITGEQATEPDGTDWFPRDSFYRILQPWDAGTGSILGDQVSWSSDFYNRI